MLCVNVVCLVHGAWTEAVVIIQKLRSIKVVNKILAKNLNNIWYTSIMSFSIASIIVIALPALQ